MPRGGTVRGRSAAAVRRVRSGSLAEGWALARRNHLGLHATALAAQLLIALLPLVLVLVAVLRRTTGSGAVYAAGPTGLWVRSVFSPAAVADLGRVFASTRHVARATTAVSLALLAIGVIGVPATFQRIAEICWELSEAPAVRAVVRQLVATATVIGFVAAVSLLDTAILHAGLGILTVLGVDTALSVPFLVLTQRLVLGSRVPSRELIPGAVAAAGGLLVLNAVAAWTGSGVVTGTVAQFGPIGVVFAVQAFVLTAAYVLSGGVLLGAVLVRRRRTNSG